jgi:two-component system, OmpR family, copper resistance phosphate regulon response regulator CusR
MAQGARAWTIASVSSSQSPRAEVTVKVLIVEDERKTAEYLRKGLTEHGFVVDVANNGVDGLHLALTGDYILMILDIMLPDKDGWSVIQDLKRNGKSTPVLFLTARDSVEDKVRGLELGGDDYLTKPFAFSEFLARVRTILRRGPQRQPDFIRVVDLEVDFARHRASRGGKRLDLSPKEFAVLWLLVRHQGEVLSRTLISEHVWDINFDSDANVIDVAIRRLRRKVDDPYPEKLIHTVRGVGYVLEDRNDRI